MAYMLVMVAAGPGDRQPYGYLDEYHIEGVAKAVVEVYNEAAGELVYALRLTGNSVRPWVFANGRYTIKLGDPDTGVWKTFRGQTVSRLAPASKGDTRP